MLGLGLGLSKKTLNTFIGKLDTLGISNNAVMVFSPYKRLLSSYKGDSIELRRSIDNEVKWFGFDGNGNLKTQDILAWVGSGSGKNAFVRQIANQASPLNPIQQLVDGNQPQIVFDGVLTTSGVYFNGTKHMTMVDYLDIEFTGPPFSWFLNTPNAGNGYIFAKNLTGIPQYGSTSIVYLDGTARVTGNGTFRMFTWKDGLPNGLLLKYDGTEVLGEFSGTLTDTPNFTIGARAAVSGVTSVYVGNIKEIILFNSNVYNHYSNLI
jgi:hypothetical protein